MNRDLQKARVQKGMTRAALARAARLSPHTIKSLEEGAGDLLWSLRPVLKYLKLRLSPDPVALARIRKERRKSLSALACEIGVSRQTLLNLEEGRCGNFRTLRAAADALNVRLRLVPDRRAEPTWYTPPHILDALYSVFGRFDLDPCSPDPPTVNCRAFFTEADDGLQQPWHGAAFCNPPYEELPQWTAKMVEEFESGRVRKLIGLVPANVGTGAWRRIRSSGAAIFVLESRLKFGGRRNTARFPSAVIVWGATGSELDRLGAALPANDRLFFDSQQRAAA